MILTSPILTPDCAAVTVVADAATLVVKVVGAFEIVVVMIASVRYSVLTPIHYVDYRLH